MLNMKKTKYVKSVLFVLFIFNAFICKSQKEEFSSFLKTFSVDSVFQKSRIKFPIPVVSWDYDTDDEKTIYLSSTDYRYFPVIDLSNANCIDDGFYFFYPNMETNVPLTDMVLQISGITDMYVKYYFKLIDDKWYLVKYFNYDLD